MDTKILAIVLLIIGVVALGSYYHFNPNEIEVEKIVEVCPEDNLALLNVRYLDTFENLYDSSEIFHDYRIDNFADIEAKGVKVTCKIMDKNENIKSVVVDDIGNVASNSFELGEVVTDNIPLSTYEDGVIFCYVSKCDNCIKLYEGIPELVEYYHK